MLHQRLRFGIVRNYYVRNCSTKKSDNNGDNISETSHESDKVQELKPAINSATERINQLLKGMIEDKAKMDAEATTFKSKFPNENRGFKKQPKHKQPEPATSEDSELNKAATAVAESLGDNTSQIKDELLAKATGENKDFDWSNLIAGMKVDRTSGTNEDVFMNSRAQQVHSVLNRTRNLPKIHSAEQTKTRYQTRQETRQPKQNIKPVDIFGGPKLNIFKDLSAKPGTELKMWNYLKENELQLAVTNAPTNYYQKMIMWTKQGKIWKFPIDNEQGLDEEKKVDFSEHVFLENHLEGWCPTRGPIRHFMELVCVGLSKNPYFTAKDKRENILWYRDYFESKRELLTQIGAYEDTSNDKSSQV